jgi:hypothetical protein
VASGKDIADLVDALGRLDQDDAAAPDHRPDGAKATLQAQCGEQIACAAKRDVEAPATE